jgi:hypothetical protein
MQFETLAKVIAEQWFSMPWISRGFHQTAAFMDKHIVIGKTECHETTKQTISVHFKVDRRLLESNVNHSLRTIFHLCIRNASRYVNCHAMPDPRNTRTNRWKHLAAANCWMMKKLPKG